MILDCYKPTFARKFVRASSQYLSNASTPVTAVPITIAAWFNSSDVTNSQELVASEDNVISNGFRLNISGSAQTVRAISVSGGTNIIASSSGLWKPNCWQHGCAVFASITSRTAYANGVAGTPETTSNTPSTSGLLINVGRLGPATNHLDGYLAWPAIWNVALAAADIARLAAGAHPLTVKPESLVAFWDFDGRDTEFGIKAAFPLTNTGSVPVNGPGFLKTLVRPRYFLMGTATAAAASPGYQTDWPNPSRRIFHGQHSGFFKQTELNLIGQDVFFGVAGNPNEDWPVPKGPTGSISLRTWTDPVKLNLAGLDQFFAAPGQSPGQHDWPVPAGRTPVVTLKTHAQPTPLNLLGQDTFYASAGQVPTYEFPVPIGRKSAISLRHADNNLLQSTLLVVAVPSGQWDWPVPKGRSGSVSLLTFTDQFKLELIGQDQFFGVAGNPLTDWPVPRTRNPPPLSFTLMVSPGLNVVPDVNLGGAGPVIQGFFIPRIAMGYFPEGEP